MKHFLNSRNDIVTEALDGLLAVAPLAGLARLNGYPHIKVVVRTDWDKSRVAVISGGGSGHEPAHVGFIGEGMLAAAVCGEIFASPSVDAVLAAIMAVTGEAGCLLIVKNYSGDRLNFGLAAERAKTLGYKVGMVVVGDDVAITDTQNPRGVAGTLFVHKIAGFMAAQGESLEVVERAARAVAASTRSIGLALQNCSVPGSKSGGAIGPDEAELGLGIHGEPGASKIPLAPAQSLMDIACGRLTSAIGEYRGALAVILNNLGAVSALEMGVLADAFLKTELAERCTLTIGPARLMTSLDMVGFSISVLKLNAAWEDALMAATRAGSWPGVRRRSAPCLVEVPDLGAFAPRSKASSRGVQNEVVRGIIEAVCQALLDAEDTLNHLDSRIGDGDTGTTFASAARCVQDVLDSLPSGDAAALNAALGALLCRTVGGSSGVLMAIFFTAAGEACKRGANWAEALSEGARQIMYYGGARQGDRTMLDAMLPALECLVQGKSIMDAAVAARRGADATANMRKARAGRAAYMREDNLAGVKDPGAEALARAFETLAAML